MAFSISQVTQNYSHPSHVGTNFVVCLDILSGKVLIIQHHRTAIWHEGNFSFEVNMNSEIKRCVWRIEGLAPVEYKKGRSEPWPRNSKPTLDLNPDIVDRDRICRRRHTSREFDDLKVPRPLSLICCRIASIYVLISSVAETMALASKIAVRGGKPWLY